MRTTDQGHSLIELLTTLAVLGLVTGFAVPAFSGMLADARRIGTANDLVAAMHQARYAAVTGRHRVWVCPVGEDDTCGDDWQAGWMVYTDRSGPLHRQPAPPASVVVLANRRRFGFNPHGWRATNGTLVVCVAGRGSSVVVAPTGRIRTTRDTPRWADCG